MHQHYHPSSPRLWWLKCNFTSQFHNCKYFFFHFFVHRSSSNFLMCNTITPLCASTALTASSCVFSFGFVRRQKIIFCLIFFYVQHFGHYQRLFVPHFSRFQVSFNVINYIIASKMSEYRIILKSFLYKKKQQRIGADKEDILLVNNFSNLIFLQLFRVLLFKFEMCKFLFISD